MDRRCAFLADLNEISSIVPPPPALMRRARVSDKRFNSIRILAFVISPTFVSIAN